jgi:hypothetical protein
LIAPTRALRDVDYFNGIGFFVTYGQEKARPEPGECGVKKLTPRGGNS